MKKPRDWKDLSLEEKLDAIIGMLEDAIDLLNDVEEEVVK